MANFAFDPAVTDQYSAAPLARTPWNNVIFPGNYVAHLNAYRKQGVTAIPGVQFFRQVGAYVVDEDDLNNSGELPIGSYDVMVLSPDLRQDDKPRRDYRMQVPNTAGAYRISVNTVNLQGDGSSEISITPTPIVAGGLATPTLEDDADGNFPVSGEYTVFDGLEGIIRQTADVDVSAVIAGGNLTRKDVDSQAAIIVEVCFFMDAAAPDYDDIHLPYKVEAGSGT